MTLVDFAVVAGLFAAWYVLNRYLLPRLGVPT